MGFHIILKVDSKKLIHKYIENLYELAELPILEDSIIYQGEPNWEPHLVINSERYKPFADSRYRGSVQAERLFMRQALEKKYILESIDQNPETFSQYYSVSKDFLKIKRGDFLIRNVGNIEIEVKCKTMYGKAIEKYFYFEKEHLEKHLKMQELTKTPIILAVYERICEDEKPNPSKLFMVDMDFIKDKIIKKENLQPVERDWGLAYKIPLKKCKKGFALVEYYKKKLKI